MKWEDHMCKLSSCGAEAVRYLYFFFLKSFVFFIIEFRNMMEIPLPLFQPVQLLSAIRMR